MLKTAMFRVSAQLSAEKKRKKRSEEMRGHEYKSGRGVSSNTTRK